MSFCPGCGSKLFPDDKFCTQCGVRLGEYQINPDPEPENAEKQKPLVNERNKGPISEEPKKSGRGGRRFLLLLFLIVLAAGGYWLFNENKDKITGILSNEGRSEEQVSSAESKGDQDRLKESKGTSPIEITPSEYDKTEIQTSVSDPAASKAPAAEPKVVTDTKVVSSKPSPGQSKPGEGKKTAAPVKTAAAKKTVVLYSNWNSNLPLINNPVVGKNRLTVSEPVMITRITTYHWNFGRGDDRGGEISLTGPENYGPFQTKKTVAGDDGTPNAKWIFEPGVVLKPGSYRIEMPKEKKKTWSYNIDSEGKGFVIVEGYYTSN